MGKFFDALADQISNQFGLGENTNRSLDIVENGHTRRYGQLGDFANKFDQSAERHYLEEGYLRKDLFNVNPKQLEILMQEPEITVLIKKKMFSSIAENFRPDLMDSDEKLFYKCTKILLKNKCDQISAFEKLSKIEKISTAAGEFDTQMLPIVMNLVNQLQATSFSSEGLLSPLKTTFKAEKLSNVIEQIRKVYAFSPNRKYTSWITDDNTLFKSELGEGTGVIELTNVSSLNTTTTVSSNGGSFDISISDPYQLMLITESDIEKALSDATNMSYNHIVFQLGKESVDTIIDRNKKILNDKRRARGASDITFNINPDTLLGEKVVAIVDGVGEKINFTYDSAFGLGGLGIGKGVKVSDEYLIGGALLGDQGLNTKLFDSLKTSELSIFQDIIRSIFNKLQLENNSRSFAGYKNEKVNYTRNKLRFYFLGKRIIQPMDQIHIYIGSKSMFDNKILAGLQNSFNAYGFLKNLDNTVYNLKQSVDMLFNPSGNIDIQMEKAVFVGENFPNSLWSMMRNQFVNERSGTHVFAGIVNSVSGSYSEGNYNVSVRGSDNMGYFDQGFVNYKPSAEVFNGALYNPLTPFKTNFDSFSSNFKQETPQLLDENAKLLGLDIIKSKIGPNAGKIVSTKNLFTDFDISKKEEIRKIFYAPDGLVYRWKEGIGMFTQFGDSFSYNEPGRMGTQSMTTDPFAGQDVMNVLSLLVTGEPYNFANYYKASVSVGNYSRDPQTGQDSAYSFYASLKNDLTKRNMLWGNFLPFKKLEMDDETFKKVLSAQTTFLNKNSEIDQKLEQLQKITNGIKFSFPNLEKESIIKDKLLQARSQLEKELDELNKKTFESLSDNQSLSSYFSIVGNDISYDADERINTKSKKGLIDDDARRKLRKKINFLTRRMSWKVRANEDQNLFIVDDYYDKDYDILAFEKQLNGSLQLYNSEFTTVRNKIDMTAKVLSLEVFCDSQGNIRVRPPQYNRMPSSIFYKMLQLKQDKGIQIFPKFLDDLFVNQLDGIIKKIEILENEIRFYGAILGENNDNSLVELINTESKGNANAEAKFAFMSDKSSFRILDAKQILEKNNPEEIENLFSKNIVSGQVFGPEQRNKFIQESLLTDLVSKNISSFTDSDRLNTLKRILIQDSGKTLDVDNFLIKSGNGTVTASTVKYPDKVKIIKNISENLGQRQRLTKIAYSLIKNLKEAKSLDSNKDNIGNKLLTPNINKNSFIPEMYENMIEDETYDDFGIDSGKRFIIKNSVIKQFNDSEQPPDFTRVEVTGLMDTQGFAVDTPSELNTFQNGNGLVTAAAVDYDMWRMYGFKNTSHVPAPFLHDPQSQCAPYAASILATARKNILKADLTIAGNEYMQPGEVVFVEDRGLLYYVESVRHSFSYGRTFDTQLTLTYGHSPGEYIPTPFDVIGKMMYLNKDTTGVIVKRQDSSLQDQNIGIIITNFAKQDSLFSGDFGSANQKTINNIINQTGLIVESNSINGSNKKVLIELRIYYDENNPISSSLKEDANTIKSLMEGAIYQEGNIINKTVSKDKNLINIVEINLKDTKEFNQKSPSQKAIDASRNLSKKNGLISDKSTTSEAKTLYNNVIDCWISIEFVQPDIAGKPSQ